MEHFLGNLLHREALGRECQNLFFFRLQSDGLTVLPTMTLQRVLTLLSSKELNELNMSCLFMWRERNGTEGKPHSSIGGHGKGGDLVVDEQQAVAVGDVEVVGHHALAAVLHGFVVEGAEAGAVQFHILIQKINHMYTLQSLVQMISTVISFQKISNSPKMPTQEEVWIISKNI